MPASILIVDDDINIAKAINRVLSQQGYTTSIATSGFEAGIAIAIKMPELITLDIHMPQMNGSVVLEVLRSMPNFDQIKILIISASDETEMQKMVKLGADDYLVKPFENHQLVNKVEKLLEV